MKKKLCIILTFVLCLTMLSTYDVKATKKPSAAKKPSVTKTMKLTVGQSKTIKVKGSNIKSKKYKTLNKKIAVVTKKGKVTAKKAGSCKIIVTIKYKTSSKTSRQKKHAKKYITKKYTCKIMVKKRTVATSTSTPKPTEEPTTKPTEEPTTEVIPAAPEFTVDYVNSKTVEAIPDTVEYCVGENTFDNDNDKTVYQGKGETITVNPGQKIYFRYSATETQKASQIFVLEPKCLKLESIGIATVNCISQNYNYRYEIRKGDDGVKYDFYLSNTEIEDTSIITNEDIQTIIYKEHQEYYVTSNSYYKYVYVRLAGTEEAFASDWVLAQKLKVDNEFNFDDIP